MRIFRRLADLLRVSSELRVNGEGESAPGALSRTGALSPARARDVSDARRGWRRPGPRGRAPQARRSPGLRRDAPWRARLQRRARARNDARDCGGAGAPGRRCYRGSQHAATEPTAAEPTAGPTAAEHAAEPTAAEHAAEPRGFRLAGIGQCLGIGPSRPAAGIRRAGDA